jgi:hypothetical protein
MIHYDILDTIMRLSGPSNYICMMSVCRRLYVFVSDRYHKRVRTNWRTARDFRITHHGAYIASLNYHILHAWQAPSSFQFMDILYNNYLQSVLVGSFVIYIDARCIYYKGCFIILCDVHLCAGRYDLSLNAQPIRCVDNRPTVKKPTFIWAQCDASHVDLLRLIKAHFIELYTYLTDEA